MIISASRRTDIPALYSEWFLKRLEMGYAMMPNPRNANRMGSVKLSPDYVDCIVFWTKNAGPMLDKLKQIEMMGHSFYFQFTLTPYDQTVERNLPPKAELVETFRELSRRIGTQRVVWRYDPVMIDSVHTVSWHLEKFNELCRELSNFTQRCVFSFIDKYRSLGKRFRSMDYDEMVGIASGFSEISGRYGLALYTCTEEIDLREFGIEHSACIDQKLIEQIIGYSIKAKKDANQRSVCGCIESVDIGAYDTCVNGCSYCYATSGGSAALRRFQSHDPNAPTLIGYPGDNVIVTDRTTLSQKKSQLRLF